ncbi:Piwi-domain-containing protein [Artomyces pyxidatus]|uniref:Piwi-domain-containing protein n=1 Tax=Artomyces pyxidatus TaxID=48021 RepID=A0ACB8T3P5_9AGAM|nr:Piwi-domain-containing protein [Artomyces pyxidatus]
MSTRQVARPVGTAGERIKVKVNAFVVSRLPTVAFLQYDVLDPPMRDVRRAQEIVFKLQTLVRPDLFQPRGVFDGRKNFFISSKAPFAQDPTMSFTFSMSPCVPPPTDGPSMVQVRLVKVGDINPGLLNQVVAGRADSETAQRAVNLLQVLIRQAPIMSQNTYNSRSVFSPQVKRDIGGGFELWRGYFQSVRPSIGKMIINVDVSTAAMYKAQPVLDWCIEFLSTATGRRMDVRDLGQMRHTDQLWKQLKIALKNVLVSVRVPKDKRRARPIKDLVENVGAYEFTRDGIPTTIREHFMNQNNYRLEHPRLFGLRVNTKRDIVIPAEVCDIVGGQMYKKTLAPGLSPKVLAFSSTRPEVRLQEIEQGVQGTFLDYANSDYVSEVGMSVEPRAMSITGRLLVPPTIQYNGSLAEMRQRGVWNVVRQQFYVPAPPSVWVVVSFVHPNNNAGIVRSVTALAKCCTLLAVHYSQQVTVASAAGGVEKTLDLFGNQNPLPNLIIVVLPDNAAEPRKIVKFWSDTKRQSVLATQCLKVSKLERANDQYYNNVALKINMKLGGTNSLAVNNAYNYLKSAPTMVIGADVSHPGPGVQDRPSITSLVASYEANLSRYAAFTRVQPPRQEIIVNLAEMVLEAIMFFFHQNGTVPPQRIIFYRDGVSEGEYKEVAAKEVAAIRQAWARFCQMKGRDPAQFPIKLTFLVVGKRHHVRFFPGSDDPKSRDNSGNVPAGLVVDTEVASPSIFDFYLQSHSGLKGTSRSGHYILLHDDNNLEVNHLQELSYYLCYVYGRATRSVSIPAPLVCARAGMYFKDDLRFSDVGSSAGSEGFDLQKWERGFTAPGATRMFFM